MFSYDVEKMKDFLAEVIRQQVNPEVWNWLNGVEDLSENSMKWNGAFAMILRKTGKHAVQFNTDVSNRIEAIRPNFSMNGWTIDRLCRVYLLLSLDASDKEMYTSKIENLFRCGEVSELEALYSSLPLLAYPTYWTYRCTEGIRSNIGTVLESIMYANPFPAEQLDEKAWNQLVLKAIFTDKDLNKITGLRQRANKALADSLVDYANERSSAKRSINPQLWSLVGNFIDEQSFAGILRVFNSEGIKGKKAILSSLSLSHYEPAKTLLQQNSDLFNSGDAKPFSSQNITA